MRKLLLSFYFIILVSALIAEVALFSVTNNAVPPDTIFAVYPSGIKVIGEDGEAVMIANRDSIRMYIDETQTPNRASRGGFAVGGVASRTFLGNYLTVEPDSTRIYFNEEEQGRASRGGFAVGGVASRERSISEYLSIKTDQTSINVKNSDEGFSVGNIDAQAANQKFFNISQFNSFIGSESGVNNMAEGQYNTFLGYQSGFSNTEGSYNSFMGYKTGFTNTIGNSNVFIGNEAGLNNNGVIGSDYLGCHNVFIGNFAGRNNTEGQSNVFIGKLAGLHNEIGKYNVYIGKGSASQDIDGEFNTYVGGQSGEFAHGSHNVFIGFGSGSNVDDSGQLRIQNSSQDAPLISGDFSQNTVEISDVLRITPSMEPADPTRGMMYYDNMFNTLRIFDGEIWHDLW